MPQKFIVTKNNQLPAPILTRATHGGPVAYGASWHVQLGYSDWTATKDPMAGQWWHSAGPNARVAWLYARVRSDSRWVGVRMH